MIKQLLFPCPENKYTPYLTHKLAILSYTIILLGLNFFASSYSVQNVVAEVDFSSIYHLHNEERIKRDLKPFSINTSLINSANAKAAAMMKDDCWAHYCPVGVEPWTFFDQAGYNYIFAGENLAEGFEGNENAMQAWMNSTTHRDNILNSNFTEIGIGFAKGEFQGIDNNTVIVVHFGSRNTPESADLEELQQVVNSDSSIIKITSPIKGAVLPYPRPVIEGTSAINSTIRLFSNGDLIGETNPAANKFKYVPEADLAEGDHSIQAITIDRNNTTNVSKPISISIDTIEPKVLIDTLKVTSVYSENNGLQYIVSIKAEDNPLSLKTSLAGIEFFKSGDNNWEATIPANAFQENTFTITAIDLAGNTSVLNVDTHAVLGQASEIPLLEESQGASIMSIVELVKSFDLKVKINITFVLFLLILFLLDYYVLRKMGLTGMRKHKTHLHIAGLSVILVVIIMSSVSGQILTGVYN